MICFSCNPIGSEYILDDNLKFWVLKCEKTLVFSQELADLFFWTSFNLAIPQEQPKSFVATLGKFGRW